MADVPIWEATPTQVDCSASRVLRFGNTEMDMFCSLYADHSGITHRTEIAPGVVVYWKYEPALVVDPKKVKS